MAEEVLTNRDSTELSKTIIVLGAGASAADGAPLQGELFRQYFQSSQIQERVDSNMKRSLQRYFTAVWGINVGGDVSTVQFPTFEEALGILDIVDTRKESFRGMGDDPHATGTQELRNHLTALIGLILHEELDARSSTSHQTLINSLRGHSWLSSTALISLNYDLLIDNAIEYTSFQGRNAHALPDYGVEFTPEPHSNNLLFPKSNLLLKLHGSLNWLYCPTCGTLQIFPHQKITFGLEGSPRHTRCSECRELRVSTIIPPTFFKVMSNFYLQQIWKRAEEELKQASRIIFCGYSFPDADMHIKYLLKRAEVNRLGEAPKVFIVNEPDGKEEQERKMERNRYMRFFRQKDLVHWTKLSFEQFAENPTLIEDGSKWL